MDSQENKDRGLDNLELPAAKKICLDGNDVSNSFRNNSSLSDSTLHLGYLFSPRQSLSSCSTNDGVSNSTFSSPIHRINISDGNNTAEGENKVFTFATSEANDKSNVSTVMSDFNKASECVNIEDNDKEKCSLDNNDVSNSFRNNSSLSDSTLHLGKLFSSKQSLDSCSTNGGDSNSTTEEENKVFTTSETDDKSVVSSAISDLNKASECVNIDENDKEKYSLDNNDVSSSFRNNSSLSNSTLHLGKLFSPRQSLDICSSNDGVNNSTFSSSIHRINISIGNNTTKDENKVFTSATSETNDKSDVSTVMSDFNKASEWINIDENDKEKCSLDNNDVSNSFRNNSSLLDSTLHLGKLFSPKQSLDICSSNDGVSNSTFSSPIHRINISIGNNTTKDENKVFTSATSETNDKSDVSTVMSDFNKASEWINIDENDKEKCSIDNNDFSNSSRKNSSLSDSTLHLGKLFSSKQSLDSCSTNDGDSDSTFFPTILGNKISVGNNSTTEEENKVFTFTTSETDDKSVVSSAMSGIEKGFKLVHIDENDSEKCLSLSKFNTSNLSLKAFNVDESLDFMDETCIQSHSDDDRKRNVASTDLTSLTDMNEQNVSKDKITCVQDVESCINEDCINLSKTFSINSSNKLEVTLDYTCKPDVMGEETLALCHSSIKKDSMSPSCKLFLDPSLTSMSIDESLVNGINNIPYKPAQEANLDLISKSPVTEGINFEDSDCERVCNNSNSTNLFNEVSGCALDYTCSKSVGMNETLTDNISETSITVIYGCSNNEQQDINRSSSLLIGCDEPFTEGNANLKNKHVFKLKENAVLEPEKTSDLYDLSDLKNSFISNKTFSAEEVNFLKENLLKVMELLKTDNNSFESYKLSSENEKCELLEKIKYLESNLIMKNESCADLLNSEEKINQLRNNNIISEEFSKIQRQYNNLLQLVLVTEADWTENKLFTNFLSDLNIAQNELFIPITEGSNGYVINHKKIYDVMLSLLKEIAKSNLIKEEYNNILRIYGGCNKDKNTSHIIGKECENDIIGNLMTTFEEISNRKNYLENENTELKIEVGNKSDEIKMLISTIEDLNLKLSIKESNVAYENSITMESHDTRKTTYDLSREVAEKLIFHDKLDDSNANVSNLKESLTTLKNTLLLSEKNYNDVNLKCENYKVELQKMHELEKVYQKLLLNYNALKMDFDTKCCEIEKLNADNQNLISYVDELKCKYDTDCDKSDFNIRFETTQKSLDELGDNQNRMLASNGSTSKNLSFKNNEIALLPYDSEEKLQKEYEMSENNLSLKENMVKLEKNCDSLEIHYDSSTNELSKLQLDLNDLNEKYSELVSNFNLYKHTYTRTEDECILMKEEKQTLESELNSLKCTLEGALEESSKLKSEKEEINIKLENLLIELSDLGTTNSNLMTQLSAVQTGSDHGMDLLKNEISELELKFEASENLLRDQENKNSELKASYDKVIEDLESKNSELSLLVDSKERLEKELELLSQNEALLQQKMVEMQEDRNGLEIQFHSSKDVVSKLQSDLNNLNEKYSEMIFDYDLYKQTYTRREDDCILLKEEKQILESKMDSLKSKLDSALEDSSKLKSDKEEINIKLENLLIQLSDLETTNSNLITQLSAVQSGSDHGMDLLKNEISELKIKFEDSENIFMEHEKEHSELKASYDKLCMDLESKNCELSLIADSKVKLEKELELLNQNEILLKQKMVEMQEDRNVLEVQYQSSKDEVSKLESDLSHLTEKYSEMISDFDLYKQTFTCTEEEFKSMKEEKQSLESELNSLKCTLEGALEESSKLKLDKEEIKNNLKIMENQLSEEKKSTRDIQNCYENLKTQYDESVVEINNKTMELQNILAQLSDLETTNSNLITQLSGIQSDSDHNINLLNNEISQLKLKFEDTENLLRDQENKNSELKASYDKVCEDLESKNSKLSLLADSTEQLTKELELLNQNEALLKQKMVEMQEDRDSLEVQYHSSKDEVSKLQSDFNNLNEKYSEMISDFDLYKQTYTHTEDECILMKEEKLTLESELNSLKCTLESALEESSKLKLDKEEINNNLKSMENQLSEEKQSTRDIKNSYENLITKYDESVIEINKKTIELQNLLIQLTDLETTNGNLKNELSCLSNDSENRLDIINQEVFELKRKCETSDKLLVDLEEINSELKVSYDKVCEDLKSRNSDLLLLADSKEKLEKELEVLNENEALLKQKLIDLEKNVDSHERALSDVNVELDSAYSKIDYIKKIEMQLGVLKDEYDILSLYWTHNNEIGGEKPFCLFSEFVFAVKAIIKDLIFFKTKCSEEEMKLSSSQEEVSRLNILLDSLKGEVKLTAEESGKLQENYSSLSKQYNSLLDANKDLNIRCNSLLEKLKELENNNSLCKSSVQDLKSEVASKESIIASLSNIKDLYESTVKEKETLSSQLMEKIEEYESVLDKFKKSEDNYLSLKLEYNTLTNEINNLRNTNETLEMKCNENYVLYMNSKDNIEILQKEKEEIRKNFIKCEKDYQNSLDLVKKCQENMGNLDKQYNLSIAKLNVILKEKESYESQNLSLQKINDDLVNRIKELNCKCLENQNMLIKFRELEKSYEAVCCKHKYLEKKLIDYENLKRENDILKTRVSEKDSFSNNLSLNFNALNEKYNSLSDEFKSLSTGVMTLLPDENSAMEIIKVVGEKLQVLKKIENDLQEEKIKCENLDEECNLLNEDLKYKDVVIGDMYKDHSSQVNELKESLKKEENLRQEILLENSTLKDKIRCLDLEIIKLKTTEQSPCSSCAELKGILQKLKMDLVDNSSKVTTLQLQIEENEITNKKKIHDYRKKDFITARRTRCCSQ
nr:sporulation-specific protein 15 isoform X2 [Halyomorpha halys]